ncbi:MAG: lipocalin-like domain-containing protein [Desulfobacteraceae bacterium]|nr:lipocalin-like domain-containing protein [Desulfobacteraceae bacterium]
MTQNPFVGVWKLISCEFRNSDGHVSYPYGKGATGYIMYNEGGYMSVAIMNADRPGFDAGDLFRGTDEEKVAAASTYLSYCGRYDILENKVIHHIEVSLFPNWVGTDQVRNFEFDGDRLTLSTDPFLAHGLQQSGHLIWKRA